MNLWDGRQARCAALAWALLLAACGGEEERAARRAAPALRGASLVAGSAPAGWGLLVVPREGGPAELRALEDPSRLLWSGETRLPASVDAYPLEEGPVILRTGDGTVLRYDPATDRLSELDRVGEGATWVGRGNAGAWTDPSRREVLVVTPRDAWRAPVPGAPLWAAPLGEEKAVALIGTPEAARPVVVEREPAPAPDAELSPSGPVGDGETENGAAAGGEGSALTLPAIVTAWGRRLVAVSPDRQTVRVLSLPDLELLAESRLDGPVKALAASPSSHALYVAIGGDRSRLVAIGRLDRREEGLARLDLDVREIRPSLFGGSLLLGGVGPPALLALGARDPVPVPGAWRSDLPLGLPGARALVWSETGVAVWSPAEGPRAVPGVGEAFTDAWWLAVRWRPPPPAGVARREPGAGPPAASGPDTSSVAADVTAAPSEAPSDAPPLLPGPTGAPPAAAAGPTGAPAAGPGDVAGAGPTEPGTIGPAVAAGFYAIVASAQQREEILALTRRLAAAGFRSSVQRHRDEASEVWYRALVGPYDTRGEAEAAARQLRRERGLQAWIAEVGPDDRSGEL